MHGDAQEQHRQWGRVIWERPPALAAGSYQSFTLAYTAGSLGIDENGGIRISFRFVSDFGGFQFDDPEADNFVTAHTRSGIRLALEFQRKANVRPFQKTLFVHVLDGALAEGEQITIVFGDRSGGSRGWRIQTFVEEPFPLRVEVDPFGTHDYVVLPEQPGFDICPGEPHSYRLVLPSQAVVGEPVLLRIKCEDRWGNPLRDLADRPHVALVREGAEELSVPVEVAPTHERGVLSYAIPGVSAPGIWRARVEQGIVEGPPSNPLRATEPQDAPRYPMWWGDFHGQTGETVGTGTVEGYFDFARHFGFLDGSCHQANDFQVDGDTWRRIVKAGNDSYAPGVFVTFNGIEWSGNTPMGGDHNVLFNEEDPPLYRSTGWLARDGRKMEEVAPLAKLYEALRGHRAMTIPHIGGRPAALDQTDPSLERLVELHSAWGTFEWVYARAFARGFKVGFVCNSDGHKSRPGASYPGASTFGTLGGLTCVLAGERTRDSFWEALRSRRCYGTTGQRIYVEATAAGQPMGADLSVAGPFTVDGRVHGTAPLLGVDLFQRDRVLETLVPDALRAGGGEPWLVIRCGGSRVYGRGRRVDWKGRLVLEGNRLREARMHGLFNPLQGIQDQDAQGLRFDFLTTGHSVNFCLRLDIPARGRLAFTSGPVSFALDLADLGRTPRRLYEQQIDQFLEVFTCPVEALPRSLVFRFTAPAPAKAETPYFVRVRQLDEAKAWTSPFYVTVATPSGQRTPVLPRPQ